MNVYERMLLEMVLPIFVLFLVERTSVYRLLSTPENCAWVRGQWWLHPNNISRCRYPMGFVSVALWMLGYHKLAFWFFGVWMLTDVTDGDIARRCNLSTPEGESIDPLSDKLMYTPPLLFFSWWVGALNPYLAGAFVVFDVIGQFSRLFIVKKAANLFGKAKTFLVVLLMMCTTLDQIYTPGVHGYLLDPLLGFCVGLAFCSTFFKVIPNYWYANVLSLMNLVCGLGGIAVILLGHNPVYAFGLVFLGQFLDLFDGRAAELWGSTPKGEIFDDVADGTSFGVTVALIVATSFQDLRVGVALGLTHFLATTFRLIRFVVEKRKAGVAGGVQWFSGMPSPGGALLAGSACLTLSSDIAKAVLVLGVAALMTSRLRYPHFGRVFLPRIPTLWRVVGLACYIVMLAQAVKKDSYGPSVAVILVVAVIYLVSPLFNRYFEKKAA
jgi:CDP-diacylglycerol--serine O-phosphatidyltransferase